MNPETARIEKLFEVLGDGKTTIHTAAEIWHRIEGFGDAIVPGLNAAIASKNDDIARLSFMVLREGATIQSGIDLASFVEPAVITLKQKNNLVKVAAMSFLKTMKEKAASAIPDLLEIAESDNDYVDACAISAILQIDPNQIDALAPRIKDLLQSDDSDVKQVIIYH